MMSIDRTDEVVIFRRFAVSPLFIVALLAALIVSVVLLLTRFNPPDADIKFDWLVTQEAARAGGDAHADIFELADRYGVEISVNADPSIAGERRHPRTPGALFLQLPLTQVSFDVLFALGSFVSVVCICWLATVRPGGRSPSWRPLLLVAFAIAPTFQTLRFGGQAALISVATLSGWLMIRGEGRPFLGGSLIGLAAVFKLFPLILLVPLIAYREKKAAIAALGTFTAANAIGLLLPGVSLSSTFEGLMDAADLYRGLFSNGSFFRFADVLGMSQVAASGLAALLLAMCCLLMLRVSGAPGVLFGWLALALLVLPLSWGSYDLILLPAVASMLAGTKAIRITGLVILALWLAPILLPWLVSQSGSFSFVARALVLGVAIGKGAEAFAEWSLFAAPATRISTSILPSPARSGR